MTETSLPPRVTAQELEMQFDSLGDTALYETEFERVHAYIVRSTDEWFDTQTTKKEDFDVKALKSQSHLQFAAAVTSLKECYSGEDATKTTADEEAVRGANLWRRSTVAGAAYFAISMCVLDLAVVLYQAWLAPSSTWALVLLSGGLLGISVTFLGYGLGGILLSKSAKKSFKADELSRRYGAIGSMDVFMVLVGLVAGGGSLWYRTDRGEDLDGALVLIPVCLLAAAGAAVRRYGADERKFYFEIFHSVQRTRASARHVAAANKALESLKNPDHDDHPDSPWFKAYSARLNDRIRRLDSARSA